MTGTPALYRGGGTIAIAAAARSVLIVGRDPARPKEFVLAVNKNNLAAKARSVRYAISPRGDTSGIDWGEECDLTADDILDPPIKRKGADASAMAAAFLREALAAGPVPTSQLVAMAKAKGIRDRTLRRAAEEIGVRSVKSEFGGGWVKTLPPEPGQPKEDGQHSPEQIDLATFGGKTQKPLQSPEDGQAPANGPSGQVRSGSSSAA
jgi:hypothetical protein